METHIQYLVGYKEKNEFWAVFESDELDEATQYLKDSKENDKNQDLARSWEMYEKSVNFIKLI